MKLYYLIRYGILGDLMCRVGKSYFKMCENRRRKSSAFSPMRVALQEVLIPSAGRDKTVA